MTRIVFRDSVDRTVTGDVAMALPSLVQLENAIASSAFLERRGVRLESSEFAPRITIDDIPSLTKGESATLVTSFATVDGASTIEAESIKLGEELVPLQETIEGAIAEAVASGEIVEDTVSGELVTPEELALREAIRAAQGETDVGSNPAPAPEANATETDPFAAPPDSTSEEELPVGGCETQTTFPQFGPNGEVLDPGGITHFNGVSWDPAG